MYYLTLVLYFLINLVEKNFFILSLVFILVLVSFFFFFIWSFLYLFIFFELSRIPIILLTLIFGYQIEKINSVFYLLFYSLLSSYIYLFFIFKFRKLFYYFIVYLDFFISDFYLLCFLSCFLVKFPIFFFHFWLPKMHVEANTVSRILLAGLLLKFGVLGFSRFLLLRNYFYFLLLGLLGLFICSFICILQRDLKSLIAYSSIVHMRFILLVFLFFCNLGKQRRILIVIRHGYISVLIFFFVGEIYYFRLTRLVYFLNSLFFSNFFFLVIFIYIILISVGLPLRLSFFREFVGLMGLSLFFKFLFLFIFFYFFF